MLYHYRVSRIHSVYDGDTCTLDIDLGLNTVRCKEKVRLWGINTAELRGVDDATKAKGIEARDWLRDQLEGADLKNGKLVIRTHKDKDGKYGRLLGELIVDGINLNETLVELGLAEVYGK